MKKYVIKIPQYPNHLHQMSVCGTHLKLDNSREGSDLKSVASGRIGGGSGANLIYKRNKYGIYTACALSIYFNNKSFIHRA